MGMEELKIEVETKLKIPRRLSNWLTDDFDLINSQEKVLHLPARITVDQILKKYVKEKWTVIRSRKMECNVIKIAIRIRECFNALLEKRLLYKSERAQYNEVCLEHSNRKMSEIYGAIHLLRMFTILGELLQSVSEADGAMSVLLYRIEDFIKYMAANASLFSLDDYELA